MSVGVVIATRRDAEGRVATVDVEMPAIPRIGDHVAHDPSGISGYVESVSFWWNENGTLVIEAQVR